MDVVRRGEPRVVAGEESLDRLVRWVHAIELPDAARLLRGGELVLTTGIALPDEEELLGTTCPSWRGWGSARLRSNWAAGTPGGCRPASPRRRPSWGCP